jgi:hypothetical protein
MTEPGSGTAADRCGRAEAAADRAPWHARFDLMRRASISMAVSQWHPLCGDRPTGAGAPGHGAVSPARSWPSVHPPELRKMAASLADIPVRVVRVGGGSGRGNCCAARQGRADPQPDRRLLGHRSRPSSGPCAASFCARPTIPITPCWPKLQASCAGGTPTPPPDVLAAQRRGRARVGAERQRQWAGQRDEPHDDRRHSSATDVLAAASAPVYRPARCAQTKSWIPCALISLRSNAG